MNARRTSKRDHSVTDIREIQAVGSENKLYFKAQRHRDLTAHQKCHSVCFKTADVITGRHHLAAPREVQRVSNTLLMDNEIIMARYRGDLRTKDRMNVLQKNNDIKENKET